MLITRPVSATLSISGSMMHPPTRAMDDDRPKQNQPNERSVPRSTGSPFPSASATLPSNALSSTQMTKVWRLHVHQQGSPTRCRSRRVRNDAVDPVGHRYIGINPP
jgi:hypothetical protein